MGEIKNIKRTNENRYSKNDEPETLSGIEAKIVALQKRLKVLTTADDSDEKREQLILTGNEIVFLTRLGNYVEARQKLAPGEVLTATSAEGVNKMYNELKATLYEYEDDPAFASVIPDLRKNVSYLRDLMIERKRLERKKQRSGTKPTAKRKTKKRKAVRATFGEIVKGGKTIKWFTSPDGKKLIKPESIVLESAKNLIFIDETASGTVTLGTPEHTKPGSVFAVFRLLNPVGNVGFQMVEIHANEILKAREQRLLVANGIGGTFTAVTLIVRDMGIITDVPKLMSEAKAEATKATETAQRFAALALELNKSICELPGVTNNDKYDELSTNLSHAKAESEASAEYAKTKTDEAEEIGRAFLTKIKEEFLSDFSTKIIARDIMRITDTYV